MSVASTARFMATVKHKRILFVQYTNPAGYPPLEHSSRILADAGWQVRFLGTRALGADALRFPVHPRIRVKRMDFCPGGWYQKFHYLRYLLWALWAALSWRPHWVYASDPLGAPAALLAGMAPGVRLLYHEHDSPGEYPNSRFMRRVLSLRRKLAHKAEIVILPNAGRAEAFANSTGISAVRIQVVWNCPALEDAMPEPEKEESGDVWILFHGSIVPDRLPMTLLDAMSELPGAVKLRIIGYETIGSRGYMGQFLERADLLGLSERLHYLGQLGQREELLEWGRRSHVGISFMPSSSHDINIQHMTGASNKPFDYLACGCPLLVSRLPDWEKMFVQRELALACDPEDPASIADAIRWYCEHPDERESMGKRGRKRVLDEWNYEEQFQKVLVKLIN